jgi:peroxiredoxin
MRLRSLVTLGGFAVLALASSVVAVRAEDSDPTSLPIGSPIPMASVKMKNVDGKQLAIADVQGKKGTLVVFTCNACPWAKAWETRIVEVGNAAAKQGVGMIAINSNDPALQGEDGYDVMQKRAKDRGMHYPYVVDATSEVARAFGATRTPEAFLFDASGKLVYHGTVDDNAREPNKVSSRYLRDAVTAVAAGNAPSMAETKAFGCSIKFRSKS